MKTQEEMGNKWKEWEGKGEMGVKRKVWGRKGR